MPKINLLMASKHHVSAPQYEFWAQEKQPTWKNTTYILWNEMKKS